VIDAIFLYRKTRVFEGIGCFDDRKEVLFAFLGTSTKFVPSYELGLVGIRLGRF
jgi:hypothetical protein